MSSASQYDMISGSEFSAEALITGALQSEKCLFMAACREVIRLSPAQLIFEIENLQSKMTIEILNTHG